MGVERARIADYDSTIIEQFAARLYGKANAVVAGSVAVGAALGAAFGAVPLTSLGAAWPIPSIFGFATLLVGGIVGAMIGYVIGDARSFGYKLQAQTALNQLQVEKNTAVAADLLAQLVTRAGAGRPAARPAVQAPAVAAPAVAPAPAPAPTAVAPPPPPAPAPVPAPPQAGPAASPSVLAPPLSPPPVSGSEPLRAAR